MLIAEANGFELHQDKDFFFIKEPDGQTSVNTAGTKEELINELERWKHQIDFNNSFMLTIENQFIRKLKSI